jgi:YVTN family beta-propeller protein
LAFPPAQRVIASIAVGASPSGLAATPDGRFLLSADRDDDSVSVIDTATRARRAVVKVGNRPFGVTIDPEGRRAYTANVGSNDVSVIDLADNNEIGRVKSGLRPYAVALAQGRGFITDQYDGTVTVFDLATLAPIKRITVGDYPERIAATSDARRIIVANWESNMLSIIDAGELKVVADIKVGDGPRAFGAFLRR